MFHAALEMSGNPERWGISPEEVSGTFARLLRRGREFGGTVVVSHEIFGAATPRQVDVLREQLAEFDVHVVVTVRNLGRMLSAQWQERVKNGYDESFQDFAADVLADLPDDLDGPMTGFWRGQNLAWLLDRFAPLAPPERTHIVVTPPGAAGPEELWRRFAEAIELPADVIDLTDVPRGNESLGVAQIAFLRDVLGALDGRLTQPWFHVVFKRWFAQSLLGTVRSRKPVTPASVSEPLEAVARAWIGRITTGGYRVHGDLEELLPDTAPAGTPHPEATAARRGTRRSSRRGRRVLSCAAGNL